MYYPNNNNNNNNRLHPIQTVQRMLLFWFGRLTATLIILHQDSIPSSRENQLKRSQFATFSFHFPLWSNPFAINTRSEWKIEWKHSKLRSLISVVCIIPAEWILPSNNDNSLYSTASSFLSPKYKRIAQLFANQWLVAAEEEAKKVDRWLLLSFPLLPDNRYCGDNWILFILLFLYLLLLYISIMSAF